MRTYSRTLERSASRTHRRTDPGGDQDVGNVLLEDGFNILLETGAFLLKE